MKLTQPFEILRKSFEVFFKKENFVFFLKVQAPLLILGGLAFVWWLGLGLGAEKLSQDLSTNPLFVVSGAVIRVLNAVVSLVVLIASIEAMRMVLGQEALSVRRCYRVAKEKIWKFVGMYVLKMLILFFGFLIFVIPGVVFSVWFAFTSFEVVVAGAGARESLSKSRGLVRGRFWPVLARLFVFLVFVSFFSAFFVFLPLGLGTVISPAFGVLFTLPSYLLYQELGRRE